MLKRLEKEAKKAVLDPGGESFYLYLLRIGSGSEEKIEQYENRIIACITDSENREMVIHSLIRYFSEPYVNTLLTREMS